MQPLTDVDYLVLSSRLVPDRDGGFTISVMRRACDLAASGASVRLMTVDPGRLADHDAHRAEWAARRLLPEPAMLRNLFDDARTDAAWLREAALPLPAPEWEGRRRRILDGDRVVVELPIVADDPAWHRSEAPVLVHDERGPVGWLPGFGALYRAWLNACAAESVRPVVVVCESRQLGELLVADAAPLLDPGIRVLHATHACHVRAPYRWDSPIDPAWDRWLAVADRFDGVLWLTATQRDDVERRVGRGIRSFAVPHPAPPPAANDPVPGRVVVASSLIARKRVGDVVRAIARVRARVPGVHLHAYGAGSQRSALEALARRLQVPATWHGHASDAESLWAEADVLAFASTNEGQGLVVGEALAHGVPVVSYDLPYGPRDVLARGGGVLVPNGDVDALAAALAQVIGDRARRAELSAQARDAAKQMDAAASLRALDAAVRVALDEPVARPGR